MSIMFFYLCVEASVMGWMVTYYADSGAVAANAGSVFGEYPLAMGGVVTISSLGSVITPSLIGGIASHAGIQMGMAVLLVPAAAFALAV